MSDKVHFITYATSRLGPYEKISGKLAVKWCQWTSQALVFAVSDTKLCALNLHLQFQDTFIRQLREELRVNGDVRESRSSFETFENGKLVSNFEDKIRDKEIELGRFQEELDDSRRSMDVMRRQYAEMKESADTKDSLVRQLRRDNDNMAERLDEAYKEKASAFERLGLVQSDLSSMSVEKDWLKSQLSLAERSLNEVGKDSGGTRKSALKKSSSSRNENLQELLQLTSEYESLLKSSEFETQAPGPVVENADLRNGNPRDGKFIRDMHKRMDNIEKRVKETVITERYQINTEKEYLIQEFQNLQKTLAQHQRMHDSYAKDVEAKDNLIKRLKSIKESLESEVDALRQELLKVKEECDGHVKEKHVDNMKFIAAKSKVS